MSRSHRRGTPLGGTAGTQSDTSSSSSTDRHTQMSNEEVREIAAEGASGAGSELPYLDRIQESFGEYDVSGVRAHTDAKATEAIGANAYSTGKDVVLGGSDSLSTVAEEATHSLQQAAGRGPAGGVGQEGDLFEREADEVARRVQSGQSAVDLLDRISGGNRSLTPGRTMGVQREAAPAGAERTTREVSGKAMGRLMAAQMGIEHTKEILAYGGGNQREALEETNFNSYYRMNAMRTPEFWSATPEAAALAQANPQAATAAKARHAQGGNCGEHAMVAYDYLRQNLGGDKVSQVDVEGLDHAFVMIGDMENDAETDLVICDPWPTRPVACLWVDHFAYTDDKSKVNTRATALDDTADYAQQIYDGLSFSEEGQRYIQQEMTEEQMQAEFDKDDARGRGEVDEDQDGEADYRWIWQHPDTQAADAQNRYRMPEGVKADPSAYTGTMMEDIRAWMARGERARNN
jgi:hypothetical protein